jgi:hypothetical protein
MEEKILDFRLFLTVVLVVICFFGDRFSTLNYRETEVQNQTFIHKNSKRNLLNCVETQCTMVFDTTVIWSYETECKFVKHSHNRAVKEQP